ncbi:uncharacterized protein FIBRA_09360 [Fibroporia radiculosa]|uniref:Uncharacterized protein n=1 Tax=Fibroporia radiculosa TaxID=599839 RepID=J7RVU5_9APHY|nr:uncharacterized protein FIBRA_09360 [Fibroporia radiculosa]CCM07040.1 predicted protein [Fibroporia radiculosa]
MTPEMFNGPLLGPLAGVLGVIVLLKHYICQGIALDYNPNL